MRNVYISPAVHITYIRLLFSMKHTRESGHPVKDTSYCSGAASQLELLWSRAKMQALFFPPLSIIIPVILKPAVRPRLEQWKWKDGAATECWRKHLLSSRVTISHNLSGLVWAGDAAIVLIYGTGIVYLALSFISACNVFWCAGFGSYRMNRKI